MSDKDPDRVLLGRLGMASRWGNEDKLRHLRRELARRQAARLDSKAKELAAEAQTKLLEAESA